MAGSNRRAHGSRPCSLWRASSKRSVPGTPTLAPPKMAVSMDIGLPATRNRSGLSCCRCGLATVVAREFLRLGPPMQGERTPAQAGGLRFDQVQHQLYGDGSVRGTAARAQHAQSRVAGVGIGRDHHLLAGQGSGPRPGSPDRARFRMALARRAASLSVDGGRHQSRKQPNQGQTANQKREGKGLAGHLEESCLHGRQ